MTTASGQGQGEWRRNERLLVIAIAAMVVSFAVAEGAGLSVEANIHDRAEDLYANAAPSIETLSSLRFDLQLLEQQLRDHATTTSLIAIDRRVERDFARYDALPEFSDEPPVKATLRSALDRLRGELDAWRPNGPDAAAGVAEIVTSVSAAREAAKVAIEVNSHAVGDIAKQIERIRAKARTVTIVMFAVSAALTAVTAFLLARMFRRARVASERLTSIEAARADELERFAGRVAHDILSPLSSTTLAMGMALASAPAGSSLRGALERGQRGLAQARSIVSDLYEFARSGAKPHVSATSLSEVVQSVAAIIADDAAAAGVALEIGKVPDVEIACSPGVLTSILGNLLRNAVKYTAGSPRRAVSLAVGVLDDRVRFDVHDTGPGIPPEATAMVFEPFVRLPSQVAPGLGLGLATVKKLTEAHHGKVGVTSIVGEGSTFWVELPCVATATATRSSV